MKRRLFGLSCAAFLCACGSRVDVQGTQGGSGGEGAFGGGGAGGGGTGGEGTGASTQGGGGSGGAIVCNSFELTGPPVLLPAPAGATPSKPSIFALSDGRASVLFSGGGNAFYAMAIAWLGAWPPGFEAPVLLDSDRGWSFAVTRGPSSYSGVIAGSSAAQAGLAYSFVDPVKGPYAPSVEVSPTATRALTVRVGQYRYLVGMEEPGPFLGGPSYHFSIGWAHQPPNGIQYEGPFVVGCSDQPGKVDGIETEDGWLVAAPVPYSECLDDVGPSAGQVLTVTRFALDGTYFGLSLPFSTPISDIEVVREPPGGWVVYGLEAGDMNLARVEAVKMDSMGLVEMGPIGVSPPNEDALGFDVSPLSDGKLAMVYTGAFLDGAADLSVAIVGAGGLLSEAVLDGANPMGKPRIWADPSAGAALVAFETMSAGAPAIKVARFGCIP